MGSLSAPKIRVLFAVNVLAVGGSEMFLLRKIQKLRERGHFAALAYCEKKGENIDFYLRQYLENQDLYSVSSDFSSFQPLIKKLGIEIVHTVQAHPYFLKLAKEIDSQITCVSTLTPEIWEADKKFNHRLHTDAGVTKSKAFLKIVRKQIPKPPRIMTTIENGIDLDQYAPARPMKSDIRSFFDISPGDKIILHIARMHPVKNLGDSLAVAHKLCERRNDCVFLLVGGHKGKQYESYFEELSAQREKLSLKDRYLFLGERTDIREILTMAECILSTTQSHEGTPNSLLEAMSMGKPVVAFRCDGISDVIKDRITGFITDGVSDSVERINELLDDPVLSARMGKAARTYCMHRFDLNQSVSKYESLYRQLLDGKRNDLSRTYPGKWNDFRQSLRIKRNLLRQNR